MSKTATSSPSTAPSPSAINPSDYSHSPIHYAVILNDHNTLTKICSSLPKPADPTRIQTESESLTQEKLADQISAVLDRRDNPNRETPLHLAVRLSDVYAVKTLAISGADISLQNASGWNSLQEAVMRRCYDVVSVLVQYHHLGAWYKWRRRLPRVIAVLRRMRDFYMEISFHFESSIVPFVGKIAPSDTYKIWKIDGNLRADTSLAGYDGLKIQRANQSFLFLGDGAQNLDIRAGSLLVLNHDERKIFDAFENAGSRLSDADVATFCNQTSVYRPGMDVTHSMLVGRTNWRGAEKSECVGEWKARVYDVNNVTFSFRSKKITGAESEQVLPLDLQLDEDSDGFLVAENPRFSVSARTSFSGDAKQQRRHSSFIKEERENVMVSRKSVDIIPRRRAMTTTTAIPVAPLPNTKEKEYVKSLKPSVWLTEQFPLKTEELLPLLDILANKVKAVRRMRELLTTKFPPGTFPVKLAIPVVPTVRVVITFTKFVELQPIEQFYTPFSSPRQLLHSVGEEESSSSNYHSFPSASTSTSTSSSSSWLSRSNSQYGLSSKQSSSSSNGGQQQEADPFAIPSGYSWSSFDDQKNRKMKKSKSTWRPTK